MSEMDEIIREFLIESNDGLDQMDRDLVELEKDPACRELLASIFRAIHTIKGTSGVLGFPRLESVAHVGENLLSPIRDGKMRLTPQITTALLAMVDVLRSILAEIGRSGVEGERDCTEIIASLNALLAQEQASPEHGTSAKPVGEILIESGVSAQAVKQALQQQQDGDPRRVGEILVAQQDVKSEVVLDALNRQADVRPVAASSNIRVDVSLLDKMMNLVGELVLARNQILQFTATHTDATLISAAQRLNLITTELQEGVMKTRMQPIGNVWNKFPRLVRDLALSCRKQVRVELEGSETELDKTIIEGIKDPLTHIVRNAIDHGIEPPDSRQACGKPPEGRLSLRAFHEGGQVNIEIADDGAGLNLERIREKAQARGLVSPERLARMSDRELINLIFLPGFSTTDKVTNVSGRGVGMDVVKTNVEKIGGVVDLYSAPGQGTTIKIKIPLTLAIIPALIVTSGGERFAIPQISLLELVRLDGEEKAHSIETIHGASVCRLRGNLLPLVHLDRELQLSSTSIATGRAVNIVVVQANGKQFGLVVDEINDTEEIVVKPLGKHLKGLSAFAGATIMGDGQVALILDVLGLAQRANLLADSLDSTDASVCTSQVNSSKNAEQWLVFRADPESRMAVPLSLVSRLEEIKATAVEKAGAREVVQYRDHIMPLVNLAGFLGNKAERAPRDLLQVVVCSHAGRSVGLTVEEIVDVVEQEVSIQQPSHRPGLLGSAVIHNQVTDLIDVVAVLNVELASPMAHLGA